MAKYESNPQVVKNWEAAMRKHAEYKARVISAKTAVDRNKYQKLVASSLAECLKWYNRL